MWRKMMAMPCFLTGGPPSRPMDNLHFISEVAEEIALFNHDAEDIGGDRSAGAISVVESSAGYLALVSPQLIRAIRLGPSWCARIVKMLKYPHGIIGLVALLNFPFTASAEPIRLTVDDAIERASGGSTEVSESRRDLSFAKAGLKRSDYWLPSDPSLSFGAYHSTIKQDLFNELGEQVGRKGYGPNYTFSLSQELEVAGQRQTRVAAAQAEVDRARGSLRWQRQGLLAGVRTAYLGAALAEQRLSLAQRAHDAVVGLRSASSDDSPRSHSAAVAANLLRLQESYTRRDLLRARQARSQAFVQLTRLCRLPIRSDIVLLDAPRIQTQPIAALDDLQRRALAQRPDLAAQEHAMQAADATVTTRTWERVPNVTISTSVSQFAGATLAGGDINIPIPVFRGRAGDLDEAVSERNHSARILDLLKVDIEKQVVEAHQLCESAAAELATYRDEILPLNEENLRLQRQLYEDGQIGTAELIGTQVDYFTAHGEYLDAIAEYNSRLIELQTVVGGDIGPESVDERNEPPSSNPNTEGDNAPPDTPSIEQP